MASTSDKEPSHRRVKANASRERALASLSKIMEEFRKQDPMGVAFLSNSIFRAFPPTPKELRRFSQLADALRPQAENQKSSGSKTVAVKQSRPSERKAAKPITRLEPKEVNTFWKVSPEYVAWQQALEELRERKSQGASKEELDKLAKKRILPLRVKAGTEKKRLLAAGAGNDQRSVTVSNTRSKKRTAPQSGSDSSESDQDMGTSADV